MSYCIILRQEDKILRVADEQERKQAEEDEKRERDAVIASEQTQEKLRLMKAATVAR